jgi:hypothetical protein
MDFTIDQPKARCMVSYGRNATVDEKFEKKIFPG